MPQPDPLDGSHRLVIAASIVVFTGNIYAGLWYPIGIAGITFILGLILLPETKDRDLTGP